MANRRVHLHAVPAEGTVSTENDHRLVRARDLGTDTEWNADAHAAMRAGIQTSADFVDGNRLPGEVENLMAIDDENGVTANDLPHFFAQT